MGGAPAAAQDPLALLPELVVLAGALAALLGGSFLPRSRQWVVRLVAAAALLAAAVPAAAALAGPARAVWSGTFAVDPATGAARLVCLASALLVLGLGVEEQTATARESETVALVLLGTCGAMLVAGADDLLLLVVATLLATVPLLGLLGLARTPRASEALARTYLLGALLGAGLLAGAAVLLARAGDTTYAALAARAAGLAAAPDPRAALGLGAGVVLVLGALLFEAGAVPAHPWVPDAAQGASATAAAFATTVPKVGALVAAYRLVDAAGAALDLRLLVGLLAVASMAVGALAALGQDDPRRLLGWSTVAQVGFALVPVAVAGRVAGALPALLLFLGAYATTNLAAFAAAAALPRRRSLQDWRGAGRRHPRLAAALVLALLGLLGTPPTSPLVGKVLAAGAGWDGGAPWLAVALVLATVVTLVPYLRWAAPVVLPGAVGDPGTGGTGAVGPVQPWAAVAAGAGAAAGLLLGLGAGVVLPLLQGPLAR